MLVVFSGYNQRAVVAFLRALTDNCVEEYVIIAASQEDTILKTVYKDKVCCVRKHKELNREEILKIIDEALEKSNSDFAVITPSTEALNRFLLDNREEFEHHKCVIPIVDKALYEKISDKDAFWSICHEEGLIVPGILEQVHERNIPCVAKPKRYFSHSGRVYSPVIIKTKEDYEHFVKNHCLEDFSFQEFIDGESFYLLYYITKKGNICCFSQKNYVQQPGGKSIIAAQASDLHKNYISEKYINLLKKLNYTGFIMIELRKHNNEFYMIEANPRFWGPSQLYYDAGIPFFEMFLQEYGFISEIPEKDIENETRYFWSGGLNNDIMQDETCVWLGNVKGYVFKNLEKFKNVDIYKREDTDKIYEDERNRDREVCSWKK